MKIYRGLFYIGLGGTGLRIGMQLEQRLRAELCGPDGMRLANRHDLGMQLSRFELPPFLQFMYVDYDESDMRAVQEAARKYTTMPGAVYLNNVMPQANSYVLIADRLRTSAADAVHDWLPPKDNEPNVFPLTDGAGQFPTVGRAALFETFRSNRGVGLVRAPLSDVFGRISNAREKLGAIWNQQPRRGCDIFVGFSVAGGTGAGVCLDFLRLIAETAQYALQGGDGDGQNNDVQIYPVVVLPSAFEFNDQDRRAAMLNGGPALKDIFDIVDNCNGDALNPDVVYPGELEQIGQKVPARTAFLFRRPPAISTMSDFYRSVVAFILSLVGTERNVAAQGESFASQFANGIVGRSSIAPDGIGRRPATTAMAAQLTIPTAEIAEILAARLVAEATQQLKEAPTAEDNTAEIESFMTDAGLRDLQSRSGADPLSLDWGETSGAQEIFKALNGHRDDALEQQKQLHNYLASHAAELAANFSWGTAVSRAVGKNDLFRVRRIALGTQDANADEQTRAGFAGRLRRRGTTVPPPAMYPDFTTTEPPVTPSMSDRFFGLRKMQPGDQEPADALRKIDDWYDWRTAWEWNEAWASNARHWDPALREMQTQLNGIYNSFDLYASNWEDKFRSSCQALYQPRTGVVYFLPEPGMRNDLENFYQTAVIPALRARCERKDATASHLLQWIMRDGRWQEAYETIQAGGSDRVLQYVVEQTKQNIESVLVDVMPTLGTLLDAAVHPDRPNFSAGMLERFRAALTALVPDGIQPNGKAPLQVQVFYPAETVDPQVTTYISTQLAQAGAVPEYHCIADANFIGVVMTRAGLSALAIPEFKQLMRVREDALHGPPRENDKLNWRQRLGYNSPWVVLSKADRVRITLRILNAMWDGSITTVPGDSPDNPTRIMIDQLGAAHAPPIQLMLQRFGELSSWSTLLMAYEQFVLSDRDIVADQCGQLMIRHTPDGYLQRVRPPSELFHAFVKLELEQAELARKLYSQVQGVGDQLEAQVMEFWTEIVPQARELRFDAPRVHMGSNLNELYAWAREHL
jgi:hypothetical protein